MQLLSCLCEFSVSSQFDSRSFPRWLWTFACSRCEWGFICSFSFIPSRWRGAELRPKHWPLDHLFDANKQLKKRNFLFTSSPNQITQMRQVIFVVKDAMLQGYSRSLQKWMKIENSKKKKKKRIWQRSVQTYYKYMLGAHILKGTITVQ